MKKQLQVLLTGERRFVFIVGLLAVLVVFVSVAFALSDSSQSVKDVTVTNITENAFTVTWRSESEYVGEVVYKEGSGGWMPLFAQLGKSSAQDDRDLELNQEGEYVEVEDGPVERFTHHVTVKNLNPETEYSFRIKGKVNGKSADIGSVTTTAINDELSTPDPGYGLIKNVDAADSYIILNKIDGEAGQDIKLSSPVSDQSTYSIDLNQFGGKEINAKQIEANVFSGESGEFSAVYPEGEYKPFWTILLNTSDGTENSNNDNMGSIVIPEVSAQDPCVDKSPCTLGTDTSTCSLGAGDLLGATGPCQNMECRDNGSGQGCWEPVGVSCSESGHCAEVDYNHCSSISVCGWGDTGDDGGGDSGTECPYGAAPCNPGDVLCRDNNNYNSYPSTQECTEMVCDNGCFVGVNLCGEACRGTYCQAESRCGADMQSGAFMTSGGTMPIIGGCSDDCTPNPCNPPDEYSTCNAGADYCNDNIALCQRTDGGTDCIGSQSNITPESRDDYISVCGAGWVGDAGLFEPVADDVPQENDCTGVQCGGGVGSHCNANYGESDYDGEWNCTCVTFPPGDLDDTFSDVNTTCDGDTYPVIPPDTDIVETPDDGEPEETVVGVDLPIVGCNASNCGIPSMTGLAQSESTAHFLSHYGYDDTGDWEAEVPASAGGPSPTYLADEERCSYRTLVTGQYRNIDDGYVMDKSAYVTIELKLKDKDGVCNYDGVGSKDLQEESSQRHGYYLNKENGLVSGVTAQTNNDFIEIDDPGRYLFFEEGEKLSEGLVIVDENQVAHVKLYYDRNANGKRDEGEEFIDDYSQIQLSKEASARVFNLSAGWNLLTFPLYDTRAQGAVQTASALMDHWNGQGADIKHIARYKNGKFEMFSKRENEVEYANDYNLIPGEAYFVLNYVPAAVNFEGNEIESAVKVPMNNGWNMVGLISPGVQYNSEEILTKLTENGIEADTISTHESGLYSSIIIENDTVYGNNFNISDKRGYFIRVEDGGGEGANFTP